MLMLGCTNSQCGSPALCDMICSGYYISKICNYSGVHVCMCTTHIVHMSDNCACRYYAEANVPCNHVYVAFYRIVLWATVLLEVML